MASGAHVGGIRRIASTQIPTRWGVFQTMAFERDTPGETRRVETALALNMGEVTRGAPLLRIHSQCLTSEVFGSLRCDCHDQLEIAMGTIAEDGSGLVIYEHQEGRGIGLMAKLRAYALQDAGLDTVEANEALGFRADCRTFSLPAAICVTLGSGGSGFSPITRINGKRCSAGALTSLSRYLARLRPILTRFRTCAPRKRGWVG
jgi:GTP cyclohydrolase II